jgi:hypothetical protein
MKGGVLFDPSVGGYRAIVHIWDDVNSHDAPDEWRSPEVFPTEEAAMRHYKTSISPRFRQKMEEMVKGEPGARLVQVDSPGKRHGERPEFKGTEESWGLWDGQCHGCDQHSSVDDMGLCEECGQKLERDLIRRRDWDYSTMAFGHSPKGREELRRQVIAQYGAALELIAPS